MYLGDQSEPYIQQYLQITCMLHKFAITNNNFVKSTISDIRHRKTYMYINFHNRTVKTVHTNVFEKNANCINLQLAIRIRKITPFGKALPHNRHSG